MHPLCRQRIGRLSAVLIAVLTLPACAEEISGTVREEVTLVPVEGAENLSPPTGLEKFSLKIWFAKPIAFIRKRWRGRTVRLACQSYVNGPVEVVGLFGKRAAALRREKGIG